MDLLLENGSRDRTVARVHMLRKESLVSGGCISTDALFYFEYVSSNRAQAVIFSHHDVDTR